VLYSLLTLADDPLWVVPAKIQALNPDTVISDVSLSTLLNLLFVEKVPTLVLVCSGKRPSRSKDDEDSLEVRILCSNLACDGPFLNHEFFYSSFFFFFFLLERETAEHRAASGAGSWHLGGKREMLGSAKSRYQGAGQDLFN